MRKTKIYPENELRKAIEKSISLAETLRNLNLVAAGGNYIFLKKYIELYGIDTSHFLGQRYLQGKTHKYNTRPLEEILVYGKIENTFALKKRLLRDGVKEQKCEECKLEKWNNKQIPLELHHLDGDRYNNTLENLNLLCPNCHALTDNYRGKNQERTKFPKPDKIGTKSSSLINYKPYQQPTKCPSKEILETLIWEKPTMHISKEYGVSDSAVGKWCVKYGIKKPPIGYWAKKKAGKI